MTRRNRTQAVIFCTALALAFAGAVGWPTAAPANARSSQVAPDRSAPEIRTDDLQRSIRIDNYTEVADSGPRRGENLYFFKCWMCHNQYAQAGPYLKDVYSRATLMSGKPVSDETVREQIKNGGPGMPAFGTTLSDPDIADLLAYIKEGKCCVEGEELPPNPWYRAVAQRWPVQTAVAGGAKGIIRISSGDSPEGIGVQLIAPNGVRTTVYTDLEGNYEFPKMQAGTYTLRIPTPLTFKSYRRDSVRIDGATKLDEIVLDRVSKTDSLPATAQIRSQLSGAELLWNLPGTGEEKATFQKVCSPCHEWQQILRNRYDERSWTAIVDRMTHYYSAPLVVRIKGAAVLGSNDQDDDVIGEVAVESPGPSVARRAVTRVSSAKRNLQSGRRHRI